jgi:uncharacterized membrane protein YagU involved in acid resistance
MRQVAHLVGIASGAVAGFTSFDFLRRFPSRVLAEESVEPPKYPWSHSGLMSAYDHARWAYIATSSHC